MTRVDPQHPLPAPPQEIPAAVVTIGVFDGVHRGHRTLVERVIERAEQRHAVSVAMTFSRHPLATLAPNRCPPSLSTPSERRRLFEALGIQRVHVLEFDRQMAGLTARAFLEQLVLSRYRLRLLVAGPDFAMGRDRHGDLGALRRLGEAMSFELESLPALPCRGAPISSSRIRTVLRDGDVRFAAELLGRDYAVAGTVETGAGRGRGLGFPTANVAVPNNLLLPANGVYVARVRLPSRPEPWPAVVNIGVAPTFGGSRRRLEAHLLGFAGELVGSRVRVRFLRRLRDERRFEGIRALTAQIEADVARAAEILGGEGLGTAAGAADLEGEPEEMS